MTAVLGVLGVVALIVIWIISLYNNLVKLRMKVDNSWSDISVFIKKRFDMVPSIINILKRYAGHEKNIFEEITAARTAMAKVSRDDVKGQLEANQSLNGALGRLFAVAENYPDLKAQTNFLDLQNQLQGIEADLANSRRYYNATVRDFNTSIQQFPAIVIAGPLGFNKRDFFELENPDEARNANAQF